MCAGPWATEAALHESEARSVGRAQAVSELRSQLGAMGESTAGPFNRSLSPLMKTFEEQLPVVSRIK